jgi:hypothetical protein
MATGSKQMKLDEHDLDLYYQEAINIAKIAGKVRGLICKLDTLVLFSIFWRPAT